MHHSFMAHNNQKAESNNAPNKAKITREALKAFVNRGNLAAHIQSRGDCHFHVIKCVSFQNSKLRLFVAGECAGCDAP